MSKDNKHSLIPKISNDYGFQKLKIKVQDVQDLEILSSLCQDGIFAKEEMIYLKDNFQFVATFSRFCWEFKKANHFDRNVGFRIVSGLQINNVLLVFVTLVFAGLFSGVLSSIVVKKLNS